MQGIYPGNKITTFESSDHVFKWGGEIGTVWDNILNAPMKDFIALFSQDDCKWKGWQYSVGWPEGYPGSTTNQGWLLS